MISCTLEISTLFLTLRNVFSVKEVRGSVEPLQFAIIPDQVLSQFPKFPLCLFSNFLTCFQTSTPFSSLPFASLRKYRLTGKNPSSLFITYSGVLPTFSPVYSLSSSFMGRTIRPLVRNGPLYPFFIQFHHLSYRVFSPAIFSTFPSLLMICQL